MKKCYKCQREYSDEFKYCNICGDKLSESKLNEYIYKMMKENIIVLSILLIVFVFTISTVVLEQKSINNTKQETEEYKYQKAINEFNLTPTIDDIKINSNWENEKDGDYIYIRGSVTNISKSKLISYFKVEAKFYDSKGSMIDSSWTNGTDLGVEESQKFKIMYKYDKNIEKIGLSIKDIR